MAELIYTTSDGVEIYIEQGKKSTHDFIVQYMGPHNRMRQPKHIHPIVEMYVKHAHNPELTMALRNHLLSVFEQVQPTNSFPPTLQVYTPEHAEQFSELNAVGEFSVEFLLTVTELLFIQEKTNYPEGSLTKELYEAFGVKDRYAVISRAVWGRR